MLIPAHTRTQQRQSEQSENTANLSFTILISVQLSFHGSGSPRSFYQSSDSSVEHNHGHRGITASVQPLQ